MVDFICLLCYHHTSSFCFTDPRSKFSQRLMIAGEFSSLLSKSDLQRFDPDESLVLAFVTAASEVFYIHKC